MPVLCLFRYTHRETHTAPPTIKPGYPTICKKADTDVLNKQCICPNLSKPVTHVLTIYLTNKISKSHPASSFKARCYFALFHYYF